MKTFKATLIQTFIAVGLFILSGFILLKFNNHMPIPMIFLPLIHLDFLFFYSCYLYFSFQLFNRMAIKRTFVTGVGVFFMGIVLLSYWAIQIYYHLVLDIFTSEVTPNLVESEYYIFWTKGYDFNLLSLALLIGSSLVFSFFWRKLFIWQKD